MGLGFLQATPPGPLGDLSRGLVPGRTRSGRTRPVPTCGCTETLTGFPYREAPSVTFTLPVWDDLFGEFVEYLNGCADGYDPDGCTVDPSGWWWTRLGETLGDVTL